jgi:hypothetical protein
LSKDLLGQGAIDDTGINRLLGVVDGGSGIVNGLVEEASQLAVTDDVNRGLQGLAAKWGQNKTKGKRER